VRSITAENSVGVAGEQSNVHTHLISIAYTAIAAADATAAVAAGDRGQFVPLAV
jgi:hypothetical protein